MEEVAIKKEWLCLSWLRRSMWWFNLEEGDY